jgi:hypothetical protein
MIIRLVVIPAILLAATVALLSTMGIQNAFATVQDCFNANAPGIGGAVQYAQEVGNFVQKLPSELTNQGVKNPPSQFNNWGDIDSYFVANWHGPDGYNIKGAVTVDLKDSGFSSDQESSINTCIVWTYDNKGKTPPEVEKKLGSMSEDQKNEIKEKLADVFKK